MRLQIPSEVRVRLASCKSGALGPLKKFFIKKIKSRSFLGEGKGSPQIRKEKKEKKTLSVLLEFLDLKNAERSVAKKLN